VVSLARRVDRWFFPAGQAATVAWLRTGLAVIIGLRIVLWPFWALADSAPALFRPPWFLSVVDSVPSAGVIVALQVIGAVAVVATVAGRRPRVGFAVAWVVFLVLAGFKTSLGKILHNDVLLLLVSLPVLAAPTVAWSDRRFGSRYGWPARAALAMTAAVYFACGWQKLVHSGPSWVFSDNMRWILYGGAASGSAPTSAIDLFIADRLWFARLAAAALVSLELAFPVVLFVRRMRIPIAAAAVAMHTMTWFTLGLDYWAWSLTVVLVLGLNSHAVWRPHGRNGRTQDPTPTVPVA
jgi:hypothetical protein